jgi:hypothetical protein
VSFWCLNFSQNKDLGGTQSQRLKLLSFCQELNLALRLFVVEYSPILFLCMRAGSLDSGVDVTDTSYRSFLTTPIAGVDQTSTETLATAAGVGNTTYVGSNYTA